MLHQTEEIGAQKCPGTQMKLYFKQSVDVQGMLLLFEVFLKPGGFMFRSTSISAARKTIPFNFQSYSLFSQ